MLESALEANSSLTTEPASSAAGPKGRLTRGSVSGNLASLGSLGRAEAGQADAQASHPSITEAATKMLSGRSFCFCDASNEGRG